KALSTRGNLTVGSNALASLSTDSNVTVSGSLSVNSAGGGLAVTAGTWTMGGSGPQNIDLAGNKVFNLTLSNTGISGNNSVIALNPVNVSGSLTVTQGKLDLVTNHKALNVRNALSVGSSALASLSTDSAVNLSGA